MRMQAKDIMHANGNSRREAVLPLRPSLSPHLQYLQCGARSWSLYGCVARNGRERGGVGLPPPK